MQENPCVGCDHDRLAPNGLCTKVKGADGGQVRCVGQWSTEKHYYLQRYIDIFTTSMRNKWNLCYVDLFAGPGYCKVRETSDEIMASPLIALNANNKFNKYIFIDQSAEVCETLKTRISEATQFSTLDIEVIQGDCNELVPQIRDLIPKNWLSLCFLDPTGLQLRFHTLRELASNDRRIDLILNLPVGTALRRNIDRFYKKGSPLMDEFWGNDSWRNIYKSLPKGSTDEKFATSFIRGYRDRLTPLGYNEVKLGREIGIRQYYYLLFASKDPLGQKFWQAITARDPHGQGKLEL